MGPNFWLVLISQQAQRVKLKLNEMIVLQCLPDVSHKMKVCHITVFVSLSSGPGGHGVVSPCAGTSGGNHPGRHRPYDTKKDGSMFHRLCKCHQFKFGLSALHHREKDFSDGRIWFLSFWGHGRVGAVSLDPDFHFGPALNYTYYLCKTFKYACFFFFLIIGIHALFIKNNEFWRIRSCSC